mmetsp:Transcript_114090/g.233467  ORF Transcript_114090/g.233467 Transcript_114090/m.233467 type:complete len:519 (+) Transcript_114090:2-1558(+)
MGVPALLLFAAAVGTYWKNQGDVRAELVEGGATSRRLNGSMYPHDYIIDCEVGDCGDQPRRALVLFHTIGMMYMLLGLNTVCDVYFTGALEVMVEVWNIKPDVAGATFMAAGGSAPELFTSLIGATIAINDVGFGTIVGSAVFNVLFVIGLCGFAAPDGIPLTWWPLFRDCSYYIFGLGVLAYCASDQLISLGEAIILFCCYLVYCTIMWHNERIERCVDRRIRKANKQVAPEELYKSEDQSVPAATASGANPTAYGKLDEPDEPTKDDCITQLQQDGTPEAKSAGPETTPEATPEAVAEDKDKQNGDAEGGDDDDDENFMKYPDNGRDQLMWYLSLPVHLPIYYLTPEATEKMFIATFLISLMWIAGFSFLLVWWVEILADILGIPTIIAGFTVLAAGTSIPDLASSVAVARNGEGDMAVSSSIGSNIFDILVGLPIPWIIKTGIIEGGNYKVVIISPYLTFYVLLLLFMVFMTVLSIHILGWTLNKPLGGCMAVLYFIFLITAVSVEEARPEAMKF